MLRSAIVLVAALNWPSPLAFGTDQLRANECLVIGIQEFTAAYEAWDLNRFAKAAALFEKASRQLPDSCAAHYWKGVADFHRTLWLLGDKQDRAARKQSAAAMRSAIDSLSRALRLNNQHAESHILLSTLYGMSIARNPVRAAWLGPRVMKHKKLALRYEPANPRAYYLLGLSHYHAPGILGGKKEALESLLKAEKLFEQEAKKARGPTEPAWGHASCLTYIGKTYDALGKPTEAEEYFRKALEVYPQDKLAKSELEKRKK